MSGRRGRKPWRLMGLAAALALTAAGCLLLAAQWAGWFLPGWVEWQSAAFLGEPGAGEPERIELDERRARVVSDGEVVWQSDEGVAVQSMLWCDIDRDGGRELLLLCWRRGRYGDSRPFWVTQQERGWSQHIFIYDWTGEEIRPIWMASDIGLEAADWRFDERERLVITDRGGVRSAWDWVSWGLRAIELPSPEPAQAAVTFAALGENLIHRQIYHYAFVHWDGRFDALFDGVREELSRYDVTTLHQETIYVDRPEDYSSYPLFGTPIQVGQAVIDAGFDAVSCASNHALDKGVEAIDRTAALYREAGVSCVGIQPSADGAWRPYEILERNGLRIALFGYTQSTNGHALPPDAPYALHTLDDEAQVRQDLRLGRQDADFCVVFVHWGTEYAAEPDAFQQRWAQVFADCGADVVLGTHPHVLQPVTWLRGAAGNRTLVYYSLGNFLSAQTDPACRRGGMATFSLEVRDGQRAVTDWGLKELVTLDENGHYFTVWAGDE